MCTSMRSQCVTTDGEAKKPKLFVGRFFICIDWSFAQNEKSYKFGNFLNKKQNFVFTIQKSRLLQDAGFCQWHCRSGLNLWNCRAWWKVLEVLALQPSTKKNLEYLIFFLFKPHVIQLELLVSIDLVQVRPSVPRKWGKLGRLSRCVFCIFVSIVLF